MITVIKPNLAPVRITQLVIKNTTMTVSSVPQVQRVTSINVGLPGTAGMGIQQVYVQDTQPTMVANQPWVWWKTIGGALSNFYVYDGVI